MHWTTWWLFATTELVLCLTPGPAVLYVLSSALRSGARRSIASTLGILAANALYYALSATGVGALLAASYNIFFAVKWAGAAYLIYLGARTVLQKDSLLAGADQPAEEKSAWRLFRGGFILQLSNPKAIVFFTALVPQFLNPHAPVAVQVVILGITSEIIEFWVLAGYGFAAAQASEWARQPRYALWTNRVAGTLLIGAGAGIATLRQ